jgi:hypothetical protein
MDFVSFKREVIKYREVYRDLYTYLSTLLLDTVRAYAGYRTLCREGVQEWKQIRQYGYFLYLFAELQNLTTGQITEPENTDYYDWSMTGNAIQITRAYQDGKMDNCRLLKEVSQWCRKWYPFITTNTIFKEAMIDFVSHRKEIAQR